MGVQYGKRNNLRRKKGFTLVELLIAAVILGITIPMVVLTFVSTILLNDSNRNNSIAMEHAQYVLEEIRSTNTSNVTTKINNGDWDWNTAAITSHGLTALKSELIDTSVSATTGLVTINVTVSWQDRVGRNRSSFIPTYLSVP